MAIRASLYVAFLVLSLFEGDTGWQSNQLILVENICLPREEIWQGGGSLSATLTPDAIRWIARQPHNTDLEPVVKEMRAADEYLWPGNSDRSYRFSALCRQPKWINFNIPGNACGLDPDSYSETSLDEGYSLVPHNADSSLQQFTFLVGLAKLNDMMEGVLP